MPTDKEIDRPLGQARIRKPPRGPRRFRARHAAGAFVAFAIFSLSGVIALRDRPYRMPADMVVATPVESAVEGTGEQSDAAENSVRASKSQPVGDGPSIIRVNPEPKPSNSVVIIRDPSEIGQDLRIAHLPDQDLLEGSEFGPLPVRAADGRRPFDVYARPWSGTRGARIAIVIGGLGLSQTGTQEAIAKLPPAVTLAFAPLGNSIGRWMKEARNRGHEIIMQVPLEPFDYPNVDPGRNTLTVAAGDADNLENLRWVLARTTNYTGIMNYMGARFLADAAAMQPLMQELAERGLMFLDDGTSARSVASDLSKEGRVPFAQGDAVIDAARSRGEILTKLDELERIARARGSAIGTGSAFGETVDAVAEWAVEARRRGVEIVPVSALADDPEHR